MALLVSSSFPTTSLLLVIAAAFFANAAEGQLPDCFGGSLLKQNQPIILAAGGSEAPSAKPPAKSSRVTVGAEGLWGQLEYFPVYLDAADVLIEKFPLPNPRTRWAFAAESRGKLPEFFKSAGLGPEFIDSLMGPASLVEVNGFIYVFPPAPMLEAMLPEQRAIVYAELRKLPQNEFHVEPVLITSGDIDTWFQGTDLKPEILSLIKKMAYKRGDTLAFSDLAALMGHASGEAESRDILKACTRARGYVVSLRINANSDIQRIVDYWSTGLSLRRKDIEPLLRSVKETEGATDVDLMHILPPLPRKLMLSYPDMAMAADGVMPDCHWTSLNFFNYDAQPYLLDSRLATTAVLERFKPVDEPYYYGDILFFLDAKNGDAFHSCVYLADGLVFSKNGRNVLSPWVITTLDELKKIYLFDGNGRIQCYRNKQSPHLLKEGN
jgi:hypothetical protein